MPGSTGMQPGVPGPQGLCPSYPIVTRASFISVGWLWWDLEEASLCDPKGRTRPEGGASREFHVRKGCFQVDLGGVPSSFLGFLYQITTSCMA